LIKEGGIITMKNVVLFTTKTCPYCKKAKEFLDQNKIHYTEKDVNVDQEARREMTRRNIKGVPAFFIGDDLVVGLDQEKILALVDHRLIECPNCKTKLRVPVKKENLSITCPKCKHKIQ
jgi:glutaredoxin 3